MKMLGATQPKSAVDIIEKAAAAMLVQAEEFLQALDIEQDARYGKIASLNHEINTHEAEIERGAALAHRLQQLRSVLEPRKEPHDG